MDSDLKSTDDLISDRETTEPGAAIPQETAEQEKTIDKNETIETPTPSETPENISPSGSQPAETSEAVQPEPPQSIPQVPKTPVSHDFGYIDAEGNIWQKDGTTFKGRNIGKLKGKNQEAALTFYESKFKNLETKYNQLKKDFDADENKAKFLGRIKNLKEIVPKAEALGDFETLILNVDRMETETLEYLDVNTALKEELIVRAQNLSLSTDWKSIPEQFKKLDEEWKKIGPVPKEKMDDIWNRFYNAKQTFFENRQNYFDKMEEERQANLEKKQNLCALAEELSESREWKKTADRLKEMDEEWKKIGPIPRDMMDVVWDRFIKAKQKFFDNRRVHFDEFDREKQVNLERKEELCKQAESFIYSTEWKETAEKLKQMQAEWKTIGPVPNKEDYEKLWARFNDAVHQFYNNRGQFFEERDKERNQKHNEWRTRMTETAERFEESIKHDEKILAELKERLSRVRPGLKEIDVRTNLQTRIQQLQDKIKDKKVRIKDIQSKL